MARGTNENSQKTFLTVAFGKLRQKTLENKQKVDADTPGAVKRKTQSDQDSWAIEYDYISGKITNIFYKEDSEYGNSFEVTIEDAADVCQVSFKEESRYCQDFLKKLPNIDLTKDVKLTVYDFTDKENKHKVGTSIEQDGKKITSFYDLRKDDKTWELLHGFPPAIGVDFNDKDDSKMYYIKVKKFLRNEFNTRFADKFKKAEPKVDTDYTDYAKEKAGVKDIPKQDDESSDLPF